LPFEPIILFFSVSSPTVVAEADLGEENEFVIARIASAQFKEHPISTAQTYYEMGRKKVAHRQQQQLETHLSISSSSCFSCVSSPTPSAVCRSTFRSSHNTKDGRKGSAASAAAERAWPR
jgi:hypothetical protein